MAPGVEEGESRDGGVVEGDAFRLVDVRDVQDESVFFVCFATVAFEEVACLH